MSFPEQDRAVQILEKEFGPRWKQIVQELGTKELRQRVGKAVSYTHLDVYKRQLRMSSARSSTPSRRTGKRHSRPCRHP